MAIIKTKFDRGVEGATNIVDSGTEGTKVASGTTAQRGSTAGQFRFNSTTGLAEYYTGTSFKTIDSPPTISSIDVTEVDSQAGGNQTFVITGSNFQSGATVTFVGNSGTNIIASSVTVDSETQITAVASKSSFLNAQEPYGVKVENTSGLSVTLVSQINVDTSPSWSTASGNIGTIGDNTDATHATVSATDSDGDTVSYSETTSVLSGAGLTLNSSTGAITGDPTDVSSDTTYSFTLRATANSKNVDRNFNIIVQKELDGSSSARAFSTMSDIAGKYTGHQTLWTTLGGNLGSPIQVKVDCSTTGGAWILVSFNFTTTGGISNNDCNDTAFGGSNGSNWQYAATNRLQRSVDLGLGEGNANGMDIYGENISGADTGSPSTYGMESVNSTPGNTSYHTISYYNHGTQSNFSSTEMTAMRAFASSMYTGIPHVAVEVDSSDGGTSYNVTTAYNDNTQANLGHTTILKNAAGNKLRPQVRKDGTDEHWSAHLWTHNTWSAVKTSASWSESLNTTGDPSNVGLGTGANGWLFPSTINYQASTGGGAMFGTPHLPSWSNGASGTGNVLNSRTYFLVKG